MLPAPLRPDGSPSRRACSLLRKASGFTLIELLVVIAIIAILAGLSFPAVQGAFKSGRKAEVRAMATQIKLGIENYYAEYGYYPSVSISDSAFLTMLTSTSTDNPRGIRFIEVSSKFTNSGGIVTPPNFYASGQSNFTISIDTNFSGTITAPDGSSIRQSVAVGVRDPNNSTNWLGTWK